MPNSIVIDPKGEQPEFVGPVSRYEVVEAKPAASDQRFIAAEVDAPAEDAPAARPQQQAKQAVVSRPVKSAEKSSANTGKGTKLVIIAGVGLGLMGGLALAVTFTRPVAQDGSTDMGAVTSTATGLKGQLTTNWGDRLNYKLTLQPSDTSYQAGFTNAVFNPARPLQIDLQLKNANGTVLCDSPILLKYDPMKAGASAEATPEPAAKGKKIDEVSVDQAQVAQALNNARMVGQELDREHGKDIFQNNLGTDGQVTSISAQGTLPCSRKQYEHAASWSFTSNFPVVMQLAKGHSSESIEDDDLADPNVDAQPGTYQQRMIAARRKVAMPVSHFSVEEDDEAVNFMASNGTLETQAGKQLQMEKRDQVALALKGVDLPIRIHYRCDQFGACAVAGLGSGIQRGWLER